MLCSVDDQAMADEVGGKKLKTWFQIMGKLPAIRDYTAARAAPGSSLVGMPGSIISRYEKPESRPCRKAVRLTSPRSRKR